MQIVDNKAVVFKTRSPDKYGIIPKSKVVAENNGVYEMAVYWGIDEARVLRNLGVKGIQSPIISRYSWPGRHKPFAHQVDTASFLTLNRRAFVFNDPGTGKTMSALWAADYLMSLNKVRRCLVLCPLSIMHDAWMSGIAKSVIHRSAIAAHHPQAARRIEMVQGDYEFVIVNYDGLNLIADEIVNDGRFDLVIVDEANAYKNVSTKRWKTLNKILNPETLLWMMTGTPASQSPLDAYGLAKLVNPVKVPKFATAWRDKVMNKITMFKWVPKLGSSEVVFDALQPAIRYTKEECTDLPPVLTETRDIPLTPQQVKYYRMLKEQMLVNAAGETITAVNAAASVNKLLQISAGAAYTDGHEVVEFDCAPRLNVLLEVLEETSRKVIVFAPFRHSIAAIFSFLEKNNIPSEVIHGDVSVAKRTKIFKQFQETPEPRILVIQPQAASHGVTLTAADTVVFYGPVMSVETYVQCIARSDRIGQDSTKVTVIHLQGSDIERKMFKRLEERVVDHNMLLKLYEEVVK
jgi:SNF2 family DNA or RNA helicase